MIIRKQVMAAHLKVLNLAFSHHMFRLWRMDRTFYPRICVRLEHALASLCLWTCLVTLNDQEHDTAHMHTVGLSNWPSLFCKQVSGMSRL